MTWHVSLATLKLQWKQISLHMAQFKIKSPVQTDTKIGFCTQQVNASTSLATPLLSPTLPSVAHLIHTNGSSAAYKPTWWHSKDSQRTQMKCMRWQRWLKVRASRFFYSVYIYCRCYRTSVCAYTLSRVLSVPTFINLQSHALLQMRPGTAGDRSSTSPLSFPLLFSLLNSAFLYPLSHLLSSFPFIPLLI